MKIKNLPSAAQFKLDCLLYEGVIVFRNIGPNRQSINGGGIDQANVSRPERAICKVLGMGVAVKVRT